MFINCSPLNWQHQLSGSDWCLHFRFDPFSLYPSQIVPKYQDIKTNRFLISPHVVLPTIRSSLLRYEPRIVSEWHCWFSDDKKLMEFPKKKKSTESFSGTQRSLSTEWLNELFFLNWYLEVVGGESECYQQAKRWKRKRTRAEKNKWKQKGQMLHLNTCTQKHAALVAWYAKAYLLMPKLKYGNWVSSCTHKKYVYSFVKNWYQDSNIFYAPISRGLLESPWPSFSPDVWRQT